MDLHSGTPYWLVKNSLYDYSNPLADDLHTEAVVRGSGITGSLIANALCEEGIRTAVIDKRTPATGSSAASTALLQYEIDIPLMRMSRMMGEQKAADAFKCCLEAIMDLGTILDQAGVEADYRNGIPSLFYASNAKGRDIVENKYRYRKRNGLPAELLTARDIRKMYGFRAPCALYNEQSGEVDAYRAATGLLRNNIGKNRLELYSHTEITKWEKTKKGYKLRTDSGRTIKCRYLIIAAGFEAGKFLRRNQMQLTTTFAIVSPPVEERLLWHGRSLIWETREPYLYIRTDSHNRIIVGGEDTPYNDRTRRVILMPKKAATLEKKFRKLFPAIPFQADMQWNGTFSSTRDGLPLIGSYPDQPDMFFALSYGGNGITFSVIASQIIANRIKGRKDRREELFGLERSSL